VLFTPFVTCRQCKEPTFFFRADGRSNKDGLNWLLFAFYFVLVDIFFLKVIVEESEARQPVPRLQIFARENDDLVVLY